VAVVAPTSEPELPAPVKRPPLTRAQRDAIRRRRHIILALGGGILLVITALVLISLSGSAMK
jgi:hypothetical protein